MHACHLAGAFKGCTFWWCVPALVMMVLMVMMVMVMMMVGDDGDGNDDGG